jgi:heme/copper-type cytochrome/quinol oxidase subunit 3
MEIPYTVSARPDTGLWNAKIGIWLFLASEVMLFGGLFSSYIFLRLGADYHWPVHELNVKMGCFNTAILIGSSVTIVMAWAGVKMRNYKMYFFNLLATILCAFTFLGVKFFEYKTKIEHYGVVLKDGTIMLGHLPDEGYRLKFNVETLTLSTDPLENGRLGSDPAYFARFAAKPATEHGGAHEEHAAASEAIDLFSVKFKTEQGTEVTLQDWPRLRQEALDHKPAIDSIKLTAVAPFGLNADPHKLNGYDATSMTFLDSTKVTGKLIDDTMELHVDVIDVRSAPTADTSVAWSLLGDKEWKHAFDEQVEHHKKEFEAGKHHGEDPEKSEEFIREAYRWQIHGATPADHEAKHKAGEGFFDDMPWAHHHYPTVKIPAKDIERWSNFLPAWNTYYAIYFCITGLHGAHVLAGALIMLYFLLFNSSWFKKDPEHLANRVETGGLFWHFVDLVWIFLFPLLYLL